MDLSKYKLNQKQLQKLDNLFDAVSKRQLKDFMYQLMKLCESLLLFTIVKNCFYRN